MNGRPAKALLRTAAFLVAAMLLFAGGFFASGMWCMTAHGVPSWKLSRLEVGITAAEAREFLGEPSSIDRDESGSETWAYGRATWCTLYVRTSQEGRERPVGVGRAPLPRADVGPHAEDLVST